MGSLLSERPLGRHTRHGTLGMARTGSFVAQLETVLESANDLRTEQVILGASDPAEIATKIARWCSATIGEPASLLFYKRSAGLAIGIHLVSGPDIVVKATQPHITRGRREAACRAQDVLYNAGYPVPERLSPVLPLGAGLATAEAHLVGAGVVDLHAGSIRYEMAEQLYRLIRTLGAADLVNDPVHGEQFWPATQRSGLWPVPHDPRFDFEATAEGAEWIDSAAAAAQATLRSAKAPLCVAHLDWRAENLAFDAGRLAAVYDLDSIGCAPEAVVVGQASAAFTTDWSIGHSTLPSMQEMQAFVADYEVARGRAFGSDERVLVGAANQMVLAYASRCEHSDRVLHPELAPSTGEYSWAALLRQRLIHSL